MNPISAVSIAIVGIVSFSAGRIYEWTKSEDGKLLAHKIKDALWITDIQETDDDDSAESHSS